MKKRKTYEISVIDKTYSKIISDETKFYTSDTALELGFELKETEYNFESAEIVLLNIDDRSLVTRSVAKVEDGFAYELDDDIRARYGEWRGQLRFEQAGETYVSSPVKFRIENDLSDERPPQLSDVQSWASLKRYADSLTEELKQAVLEVDGMDDTFNANELARQATFEKAEQSRQTTFEYAESERNQTFNTNEETRQANETARVEAEKKRNETVKNIETRQNSVENQFISVQEELTEKDVISAPEIIAARNGEDTLKARLDKENNEVTAQLQQTAKNYLTQPDYVDEINKLSSVKKMNVKLGNPANKAFNVNVELTPDKILTYEFAKNANDDYILALGGFVGNANRSTKISDMVNAKEMVGFVEKTYPPNYIVNEVGSYISASFVGTKVTFYHYCENRSGVWEFILDEGTGDERKVTKSAYSETATYKETVLFEGLEKKNHTIKAIFKGADPQNPPSSGIARGYFYYGGTRPQDTFRTFNAYDDVFEGQKDDELLYSYSNKDFAFEIRPSGSALAYNFVPEHNALGSAFKVSDPKILVDGEEVTSWRDGSFILDISTVHLVQHVKGYHLSDLNDPLMEIITYHTIKNGVLDIKGKVKFLRATEVKSGYGMMFPYWASFGDVIKTSTGNSYEIKKSGYQIENWQEADDVKSIAVLNTSGQSNLALAITYDNFNRTMRVGESGRGNPFSWIEHRNASMGKIYHKQFQDVVIQAGYEYRFGGRFAISYVHDIGQFIS